MPRIAIVSAMREELSALLGLMPDDAPVMRANRDFRVGHLDGHELVVVLSGIGKVAAATTATLLAAEFDVRCAIFTGTAGGLHPSARVGDIVVADTLLQHDMDASPLFPRHEVPLYGLARFPTDAALSTTLADAAGVVLATIGHDGEGPALDGRLDAGLLQRFGVVHPVVHRGLVVSGDRFVSTAAENAELRARLPEALAVEMEGAALAQVCHDMRLPFAVVRTVSDRADDSAHVDFPRFLREVASRYTLAIVREALRSIDR
jgi:adenosylhomocysteine nucleosidase